MTIKHYTPNSPDDLHELLKCFDDSDPVDRLDACWMVEDYCCTSMEDHRTYVFMLREVEE